MARKILILITVFISYTIILGNLKRVSASEPGHECSTDKPYERVPKCGQCGDVLFCDGNNYRDYTKPICTTDPIFPTPAIGQNRSAWLGNPGSVTYNGKPYSVPIGGLYFCDSNVNGCANPLCSQTPGSSPAPQSSELSNQIITPQDRGFTPLTPPQYPCNTTTDIQPLQHLPIIGDILNKLGLNPSLWDNLDFHPLRPYPGSPCDQLIPKSKPENQPITFACGKSIGPKDSKSFNPYGEDSDCRREGGQAICERALDYNLTVNLNDTKIPILGNTENLSLTDAQKTNNYLTWYLSGSVQNWLEDRLFPLVKSDMDRLVNFSGPLRKLLPFDTQNYLRTVVADNKQSSGREVDYHDYLAGCKEKATIDLPSILPPFKLTVVNPVYLERVIARIIKFFPDFLENRESNKLYEAILHAINAVSTDQAVACQLFLGISLDDKYRLSELKLPPDPLDPKYDNEKGFVEFWKDYMIWSGKTNIPWIGPVDLPIPFYLPDHWAQIFQNVSFSTLEDTTSEVTISVFDDPRTSKQDPEVITRDPAKPITLTIKKSDSRIYLPHLRSARALTDLLQSLSAPLPDKFNNELIAGKVTEHQGETDGIPVVNHTDNNSSVIPNQPAPSPLFGHDPSIRDYDYDARCELTDFRTNPGDSVLGDQITANLKYTQIFKFTPVPTVGSIADGARGCRSDNQCKSGNCKDYDDFGIGNCAVTPQIQQPVKGFAATYTKTPFIDEIYQKLVAGPQSIFKRFMYKLEPYGIELKDIPGMSTANYSATNGVTGQAVGVKAGDGRGPAQVYWPHLGSIYDYFLGASGGELNLQKLLRPKNLLGLPSVTDLTQSTSQIATKYGVPQSFIDAIWAIETNRSQGGGVCDCSGGKACGPMQIGQFAFNSVTTEAERGTLDRCRLPDAFELAARVLLWKRYCTLSKCTFDPANPTASGELTESELQILGRYHGTNNCNPSDETQCRWGAGYSYCDAAQAIMNGQNLPQASQEDRDKFCN